MSKVFQRFCCRWLCTLGLLVFGQPVLAQHVFFKGADLSLGRELIDKNKCNECHVRNVGGDGSGIYRPTARINTPALLRGMVEYCSTQLNLQLFPEEVHAIAAVLDIEHYKFK